MGIIVVKPAYGRVYENPNFARADWEPNKDFKIAGEGPYINRSDWLKYNKGLDSVIFSWRNLYVPFETGIT